MRVQGEIIHEYFPLFGIEIVRYDFTTFRDSLNVGETIAEGFDPIIGDTVTTRVVSKGWHGTIVGTLNFMEFEARAQHSQQAQTWEVTTGVGLTDWTLVPYGTTPPAGDEYKLSGAVVNNVHYGTILGVSPGNTLRQEGYTLEQNYPNPFNPSTTIRYYAPQRGRITLTVFDAIGQNVATLATGEQEAGYHEVIFDGAGLSTGIYFCRLQAGKFSRTRTILLLR